MIYAVGKHPHSSEILEKMAKQNWMMDLGREVADEEALMGSTVKRATVG